MGVLRAATLASVIITSAPLMPMNVSMAQTANTADDEIIVQGTRRQNDPAMNAFNNGDYATAEIEFMKNYTQIRRANFLTSSAFESSTASSITALVQAGAGEVTGSQSGGGVSSAPQNATGTGTTLNVSQLTGGRNISRADLGFELYMAGMSQLKLRKYDDAKASLKRAVIMNKRIYDAHLRIGLLELREGNRTEAQKQLRKLERGLAKCARCEEFEELQSGVNVLSGALSRS